VHAYRWLCRIGEEDVPPIIHFETGDPREWCRIRTFDQDRVNQPEPLADGDTGRSSAGIAATVLASATREQRRHEHERSTC
jgi:hypothetical protein